MRHGGDASDLIGRALASKEQDGTAAAALLDKAEDRARTADEWRKIGDAWHGCGDAGRGGRAHLAAIDIGKDDPALVTAADALAAGRLAAAEIGLARHLESHPTDVLALGLLAESAIRAGDLARAEALLARQLALAPSFVPARRQLAVILYRAGRWRAAAAHADELVALEPDEVGHRNLKAAIAARLGRIDDAILLYRESLDRWGDQPAIWMSLGHLFKTAGRITESVAAYRRATAIKPDLGEAWWGLANLKTFRFLAAEEDAMRGQLANAALGPHHRSHIAFALAKAREDEGAIAEAFGFYAEANAGRRALVRHDPDAVSRTVAEVRRLTATVFAGRPRGSDAADPIFIVGEPRSGSTLVEQMLASHPLVEGTAELPDLDVIARRLHARPGGFADALARLTAQELRTLGEEYLAGTRAQRRTDRPFFIDKLPGNFAHWALIELILPNASIIDVRRHPLACGVSCFRQSFAQGNEHSYDLAEMGRHYRDYVAMMDLADEALPGRVHRVIYERLVARPEDELRALTAAIGIGFDPAMLEFHRNPRPVRTPSAEQVRLPLSDDAVERWRAFDPWLQPMRAALGPVLETWDR